LSKTIDKSRVCPFLFGLKRSEIRTGPLLQFQSTIYERDDLGKLLHSLNNSSEPRCIDETRLDGVFDVWWPKLQETLDPLLVGSTIPSQPSEKSRERRPAGGQSEILEELLDLARNQQKLLNSPEMLLPPGYFENILAQSVIRRPDISTDAVEDLFMNWRRLGKIVTEIKEDEPVPRAPLIEILERLRVPIEYLVHRTGARVPFMRRPRKPTEEP
jgi:hypothetical protein